MGTRVEEDTFLNLPLSSTSQPYMYYEFHTAWTFEKNPVTEEEARGYMNAFTRLSRSDWVLEQRRRSGLHGATVSEVPRTFGERHELALAANSGTMINDTAQTFEQVSRSYGHAFKRLNLTKRMYVSGVRHGAAICDKSLRCKIACEARGDPAVQPAVPRLDTYSAN
eukprot:1853077-Pyramimonas_sp.AAC.1